MEHHHVYIRLFLESQYYTVITDVLYRDLFPDWKGNVFATSLKMKQLTRLELVGNHVVAEEQLIKHFNERLRTAKQGYDGAIFIVTDSRENGQLIKLTPKTN